MPNWISVNEARDTSGLRLVLLRRLPSPWGQAARCMFDVKGIAFQAVERSRGDPPGALLDWTRQNSFPAAMYNDERARTGWEEILWLAERLAPTPSLVPQDLQERVRMFGLARELMGEMGLIWCFRLFAMPDRVDIKLPHNDCGRGEFAEKYHSDGTTAAQAKARAIEVLSLIDDQMATQEKRGLDTLIGDALSAADIYLATALNVLAPLSDDKLPLSERARPIFTATDADIVTALTPRILALRDRIYDRHLTLPVEL
ncbi:MAG: glutathione S-transferase [Gammaproteobacteria bacterium]|jgi:glutathione S-transferase